MSLRIVVVRLRGRLRHRHRHRHRIRVGRVSGIMLGGDEPVDCRVHEGKDRRHRVEQSKVELLSKAGHIAWKRHGRDDPSLDAIFDIFSMGVVQVGEGPGLKDGQLRQEVSETNLQR